MRFNSIRLSGASTVNLPLEGLDSSSPFVLKGADGLDAAEVNVNMADTSLSRRVYQGKKAVARQVTLLVGLQPDWDVGQRPGDLRDVLYSLLTPKYGQMVLLQVLLDGVVQAECPGQLSRMPSAIFSKDPEVQMVFESTDAYLTAPSATRQQPTQRTIGGQRGFDVLNPGNAPTGFIMGAILRANVGTTLTLSDEDPAGQRFQVGGINWQSGDRFVLDTREGSRGVWRGAAGGTPVSVLNQMNASVSEWMQLHGGNNTLKLNTTAFDWDTSYDFQHVPTYWGV